VVNAEFTRTLEEILMIEDPREQARRYRKVLNDMGDRLPDVSEE
jgi:hypothetical protein